MPEAGSLLEKETPIYGLALGPDTESDAQSAAKTAHLSYKTFDPEEPLESSPIILIEVFDSKKNTAISELRKVVSRYPGTSVVIFYPDKEESTLCNFLNEFEVASVIGERKGIHHSLKKVWEEHREKLSYLNSLDLVKSQNRKLEILTGDLEDLVHERTLKEFTANSEMEKSVKETQSLLTFIKTITRSETIDDLMSHLRKEFRKCHGLLPPILVLHSEVIGGELFYFQGMQLTRKKVKQELAIKIGEDLDEAAFRLALSNLLGRPFGQLSISELTFQAQELAGKQGYILFENALAEGAQSNYQSFVDERWPIINMALESLLLKTDLQSIAQQWARTFNEMSDPIIIIDRKFRITHSNGDFKELEISEYYGQFANGELPAEDCPMFETFITGQPKVSDLHINNRFFKVHSYPIKMDTHGEVSHIINQYVDVTQSIDLQSRVIQGEKMAAVGLLAGNIAHELNNPLTGIRSLSDLLIDDLQEGSNTCKDLTEIRDASIRCQRIIKDLLDFSSVGENSKGTSTDVNEVIQKTLPLLKVAMRTLNTNFEYSPEPLQVSSQPQLLQQVIFNLVNNACQAMGESGDLKITTEKQGPRAVIRVTDTGPGIPAELRETIFDPFFTTKSEGKGTGLGLSMAKSVIERAGGELTINKEYGEGTEFVIKLPLV